MEKFFSQNYTFFDNIAKNLRKKQISIKVCKKFSFTKNLRSLEGTDSLSRLITTLDVLFQLTVPRGDRHLYNAHRSCRKGFQLTASQGGRRCNNSFSSSLIFQLTVPRGDRPQFQINLFYMKLTFLSLLHKLISLLIYNSKFLYTFIGISSFF